MKRGWNDTIHRRNTTASRLDRHQPQAGNLISCARTHGHWGGPALPRRRADCLDDCRLAWPWLQACATAPIWILPQFRTDFPRTTCLVDSSLTVGRTRSVVLISDTIFPRGN